MEINTQTGSQIANVVQIAAYQANGKGIAGVCLMPGGAFSLNEMSHLLSTHFGAGNARQGGLVLACSSEKPLPSLLFRATLTSPKAVSVFQCSNPACSGYRQSVLATTGIDLQDGNQVGSVAFACPRCSGGWYQRWALSWLRPATLEDLTRNSYVQYPIPPTEKRRNGLIGPMAAVVQAKVNPEPWGWHPKRIRPLPNSFRRFLRSFKQSALLTAIQRDPEQVGDLLPSILQPGNLRAFIDYVRSLPVEKKLNCLPVALSHAFCATRPDAYRVTQNSVQLSHHFYIAYHPDRFMNYLNYLGVADMGGAFLDVGSGIGEKPFIAYACGRFDRCDGLEYDSRTSAVAQFLLDQIQTDYRYPIRYEVGDALCFPKYENYEVIYMYRPMRDLAMMRRLFQKIGGEMKIGSICLDIFEKDLAFRRDAPDRYSIITGIDPLGRAIWGKALSLKKMLQEKGLTDSAKTQSS
jgi:hypothetical protein